MIYIFKFFIYQVYQGNIRYETQFEMVDLIERWSLQKYVSNPNSLGLDTSIHYLFFS